MDQLTNIISGGLLLTLYGWRIIRPYLVYRDVVSGAITSDAISFILMQGIIGGGITIYWFLTIGFKSLIDGFIIAAFSLMTVVSLYFGAKTWLWDKQNKKAEPGHSHVPVKREKT